jgi:DNA-binding transcriptional LysR family regulator
LHIKLHIERKYVELEETIRKAAHLQVENLAGVTVFVAAARCGNFTLAAEQLGISKSAVGKSIARLEARLGIQLFRRTTRSNRLTEDGQTYFAVCSAALEGIGAIETAMTSNNRVLSGQVRIDMPVAFGREVLMPLLLDLCRPHPGLELSLSFSEGFTDPMASDVDLLVRFGALEDSSHLISRHLASQPRVICASPSYLDAFGIPATPRDLNNHRGLVGTAKGPPRKWIIREDGLVKSVVPRQCHRLSDGGAIVEAAVTGFGICQMPISIVRKFLVSGELVPILVEYSAEPVEVHLLWPQQSYQSGRHRYVIDGIASWAARGGLG